MILTGKTEALGEKHFTAWVADGWMSMEQWWNDTDRGKLKHWERNLPKSANVTRTDPDSNHSHRGDKV